LERVEEGDEEDEGVEELEEGQEEKTKEEDAREGDGVREEGGEGGEGETNVKADVLEEEGLKADSVHGGG